MQSFGRTSDAETLCLQALQTCEQLFGPTHIQTRNIEQSLHALGVQYIKKHDHAGAARIFRRVFEARERSLGPEHPETLASLNALGFALTNNGDLTVAEPLYRRVLDVRERTLGKEHADTLQSVRNLAFLLEKKLDYPGAEKLYRRELDLRERRLGKNHPDTLNSVDILGNLLTKKGDLVAAEPFLRRMLESILGQVAGSAVPPFFLKSCTGVYANHLSKMGRGEREIRLEIESILRRFGFDPKTIASEGGALSGDESNPLDRL